MNNNYFRRNEKNMTTTKLSGITFEENTTTIPTVNENIIDAPLIIIQSTQAISGMDGEYTEFTNYSEFYNKVKDANITRTIKFVRNMINESGVGKFYVYSLKTDTTDGFKEAIKGSTHLYDCETIIYIEEQKSKTENTIKNKMTAISQAVREIYTDGVFREAYVVPAGTVAGAVAEEGAVAGAASTAALQDITSGTKEGLVCAIMPDTLGGQIMGGILNTSYDKEIGQYVISYPNLENVYELNGEQMLALQNAGVIFVRPQSYRGATQYKINFGVTTSYQDNKSDGSLVKRRIVNQFLREVKEEAQDIVLQKETSAVLSELNSILGAIVNKFVANDCVTREGTKLSVADAGNGVFTVTGIITPIGSVEHINVSLTIQ